ncbi:MAG TPA: cellulose synthase complex periplasmic endoglucanase BcsZ [Candidatus Angelobacter sp.]|nr:cellulose synthase complex periplasmic endoglucanase BcsZ [Candidatus Angelobacter sp.]
MRLSSLLLLFLLISTSASSVAEDWPLWQRYAAAFMDDQVRVIDHDAQDRTTSEGQAYAMFFALVADDRPRFDGLLRWTEKNLASGDLTAHTPAWLWGRKPGNQWGVIDANSAADADVWMAYTLLEAGRAWKEPRYTALGTALAKRIADKEVVQIPGFGAALLPAPKGFHHHDSYRLNASYVPLQLLVRLAHEMPEGPWQHVAATVPLLIKESAPQGFAMDWIEVSTNGHHTPSRLGSFEAIRVYLWAGLLDPSTPQAGPMLKDLSGMAHYLRTTSVPPAKVKQDGNVEDAKGPVGFSGALLPYLSALGEKNLGVEQASRVRAEFNSQTGLYGNPARYYDQNLILFALGSTERRYWFDSQGELKTSWHHD